MLLTDYTTYADIRAALGVEDSDVPDATLALALYSDNLQIELEDVALTLPATYVTTKALLTPTDDQLRFLQAARMFAAYAVAKHLTDSLPLFGLETETDGKASYKRFNNPYKEVIEAAQRQYGRFRTRLDQAFSAVNSTSAGTSTTKTYFAVASPSSDPVTGT